MSKMNVASNAARCAFEVPHLMRLVAFTTNLHAGCSYNGFLKLFIAQKPITAEAAICTVPCA